MYNTVRYAFGLLKKDQFDYVLLIDDDTLLPDNFKVDENIFLQDDKVSAICYNIRSATLSLDPLFTCKTGYLTLK